MSETKLDCYLQSTDQIEVMAAGILNHLLTFSNGEVRSFSYDFSHPVYQQLIRRYGIDKTAGAGTSLEKALRLMWEYAPRLSHESSFGGGVPMEGLALLEYSLDNPRQGINCRCKAQILNEMCLALGIYSRKVWIMPLSVYDHDCHVVNEIWDETYKKWIMLDITSNTYWIDGQGTPLSLLEIREKSALRQFCTPIGPGDDLSCPEKLKQQNIAGYLYIIKNMVYMKYILHNTVGENGSDCMLRPRTYYPEDPKPEIALISCQEPPCL